MKPRTRHLILLAVIAALALAWAGLRTALEAQLIASAKRDLDTIADLVAADIERMARNDARLRGAALAARAMASDSPLAGTLQRASDERFRSIRFFAPDDAVAPDGETPRIVLRALDERRKTSRGILAEPYANEQGEAVIGVWQWLPSHDLGIAVERPHGRFVQPLRWLDGLFAALLALLVLAAFALGLPGPRELLAGWRRTDPQRCGPYRIERRIGEGAMSDVFLARHQHLGRRVALKRLKLRAQSDEISARFDREARLASRLAHPNIVTVFDHGPTPEGGFYYAMEFIHGLTLTQWIQEHGPLPPARCLRVLRQVTAAVAAMHHSGLLHRDIKPDNIMIYAGDTDWDLVKLLDFGLIKDLDANATRDLTRDVRVLGTPAFMAPERLSDPRNIDPRTDLYGIGAVGFFLLSGRKPFEAERDGDLTQQILHIPAPAVSAHSPFHVPERLDALLASLLAKNPDWRPASADVLATELDALSRATPWRPELARLWWQSRFPAAHDTPPDRANRANSR